MRKSIFLAIILQLSIFNFPSSVFSQVASQSESLPPQKVGTEDMIPLSASEILEGSYEVEVESSSSMFRIAKAILTVKDGNMTAKLTMGGKSYSKLFLGTAEEASDSNGSGEIPASQDENGAVLFEIPVSALNSSIKCAAFSKRKGKWYNRDILFDAGSLPEESLLIYPKKQESVTLKNGSYRINVSLTGGSGRATITNPAYVIVKDGMAQAEIEWSSPNYDYMKVNKSRYDADVKILDKGGNSTFMIPIYSFNKKVPVTADTVAMSKNHEIHYWLQFDLNSAKKCKKKK